jgi:hypothetical protein
LVTEVTGGVMQVPFQPSSYIVMTGVQRERAYVRVPCHDDSMPVFPRVFPRERVRSTSDRRVRKRFNSSPTLYGAVIHNRADTHEVAYNVCKRTVRHSGQDEVIVTRSG